MIKPNLDQYLAGRVRKETRYDPLVKLVNTLINQHRLTKQFRKTAEFFSIKLKKNYAIIFLGIGLIKQKLQKQGKSKQNAINIIFGYMEQHLEANLKESYKSQYAAKLIQMTKVKNIYDMGIMKKIFAIEKFDEEQVVNQVNGLYKYFYGLKTRRANKKRFKDSVITVLRYIIGSNLQDEIIKSEEGINTKVKIEQEQQQIGEEQEEEEEEEEEHMKDFIKEQGQIQEGQLHQSILQKPYNHPWSQDTSLISPLNIKIEFKEPQQNKIVKKQQEDH